MNCRKIKKEKYKRMRKVIPHTSGGITFLTNYIQYIRTFGKPSEPFQYMVEGPTGPRVQSGQWYYEEIDLSTIITNEDATYSMVVLPDSLRTKDDERR